MGRITKVRLEANSLHGRGVVKLNLEKQNAESKLKSFLEKNGFQTVEPKTLIEKLQNLNEDRARVEKLGFARDTPLELPRVGQAHELEFPELRSKLTGQELIEHGFEFYSSTTKINGVTSLKVVSETLGEKTADATTEVIIGPASTKDEYIANLSKVDKFRARVEPHRKADATSMAQALEVDSNARGEIWHEPDDKPEGPCVHTSRGVPIKDMSTVLREPQSRLSKEAKLLLNFAAEQTDALVTEYGLHAPHGKKLWETINLAIWMAAGEGVIQPLWLRDHHEEGPNQTINNWTKYAGKNFFHVISRFPAGDLLRSGGLQNRDVEKVRDLFAGPNADQNQKNFERIVSASANVVTNFISHLESSENNDHKEIAKILHDKWETPSDNSVMHWIRRDLKMDLIPMASLSRYPADKANKYGTVINANAASPSFAHSQFIPRREMIGQGLMSPVSGALEFRAGEYVGNRRLAAHFNRSKKRSRQDVDASWNHFESYVNRVAKRIKREPKQ